MFRKRKLIRVIILLIWIVVIHKGMMLSNMQVHSLIFQPLKLRLVEKEEIIPRIYVITPTYARLEQKAELTRLSQTLRLVQQLHWVVVEDSTNTTKLVAKFLQQCNVKYTHLYVKTMQTKDYRRIYRNRRGMPRGVQQRNAGLDWVEKNVTGPHVVYFADDDNTYDVKIFDEMRNTKKVSVWPVGLVGATSYESPAVKDGKVVGWIVGFAPDRKFAVDMAAFAVNGTLLKERRARFNLKCVSRLEPCFLEDLKIEKSDLEPKADNCTKILVWHTRTIRSNNGLDKARRKMAQNFSVVELKV